MLISSGKILRDISHARKVILETENETQNPVSFSSDNSDLFLIDETSKILTQSIGTIIKGKSIHYYSYGNFNLVRLIMHIIKQTGPVHAFMSSYSFSATSIEQINNRLLHKELLSFKVLIDNRVKTMSPKPFQMLSSSLNYRCTSIHAKVALLWNDDFKISIITSQNATDNPKMERGVIFNDPDIFNFDFNALTNAFNTGTT